MPAAAGTTYTGVDLRWVRGEQPPDQAKAKWETFAPAVWMRASICAVHHPPAFTTHLPRPLAPTGTPARYPERVVTFTLMTPVEKAIKLYDASRVSVHVSADDKARTMDVNWFDVERRKS
eukprot:gene4221-4523_t